MAVILVVIATLLAGTIVLLAPGAAVLSLLRADARLVPQLRPPAAVALGVLVLAAITAGTLALHQPAAVAGSTSLVVTALLWLAVARRDRLDAAATAADDLGSSALGWGAALRGSAARFVAGDWLRSTPWGTWVVAVAGGGFALATGFFTWNDSLYHVGQAHKLLRLAHPTFDNTLQFPDGSAHPGYLVPVWEEMLALTAWLGHTDPMIAGWVLPLLTVTIAALATCGLAVVLTRSHAVSTPVAAGWVAVQLLAMAPFPDSIHNAMHPGVIALDIIIPTVLGCILLALWSDGAGTPEAPPAPDVAGAPGGRVTRAAAVAVAGTLAIALLHVSYLVLLALGILGYVVGFALCWPWRRQVVRRHVAVLGAVAVTAAIGGGALLPGLSQLDSFGRDAQAELSAQDSDLYFKKNGVELDALLRGDKQHFHLRNDHLVKPGGLALLSLYGAVIAALLGWRRRWPGAWLLAGSTLVVLGIALTNRVFPPFVHAVSLDQARRIAGALPLPIGLGLGAFAISDAAMRLWRRGSIAVRAAAVVIVVGTGVVATTIATRVDPLIGYAGKQILPPRAVFVVLELLGLALIAGIVALVVRLAGRESRRARPRTAWPTVSSPFAASALATLIVLVAATPTWDRASSVFDMSRLDGVRTFQRAGELRLFAPRVASQLRKLPVGSVVLADPRSRDSYYAMSLAPVYVVSSVPRHTASTKANRVPQRFAEAVKFYETDTPRDARLHVLLDNDVDAVIINPKGNGQALDALNTTPGITPIAGGKNQRMYLVDRPKVRAAL